MSSTFNADNLGADGDEARFLAKVMQTLDGSLTHLPRGIEGRLDRLRHAAMLEARESASENGVAETRFTSALAASEKQIPEPVRQRLDAIRAGAMRRASAPQQTKSRWWSGWASRGFAVQVSAFASICLLVTTLAIFNMSGSIETMPLVVAENSLVLASEEEIELYNNLEFYQWLADNGL